jgi:hypothetical protein
LDVAKRPRRARCESSLAARAAGWRDTHDFFSL